MAKGTFDKRQFIAALITDNATQWTEGDRQFLESQDDSALVKFAPLLNDSNTDTADGEGGGTAVADPPTAADPNNPNPPANQQAVAAAAAAGGAGVAAPAAQAAPVDNNTDPVEAWLTANGAPPVVADNIRSGLAIHNAEKARLVATITANAANRWTPEQLQAKPLGELQAIVEFGKSAAPVANATPDSPAYAPSYAGAMGAPPYIPAGTPVANAAGDADDDGGLDAPTMNFERR